MNHPFIRYGQAVICAENELKSFKEIEFNHIYTTLYSNMQFFRCHPVESFENKKKIKYTFGNEKVTTDVKLRLPDQGIFLSPHVISTDGSAKTTWKYINEMLECLSTKKNKTFDALNATTPMAGDYIKFSEGGSTSKTSAKLDLKEASFSIISTIARVKPSIYVRKDSLNFCIIPDLPKASELIDFIILFKKMMIQKVDQLMIGKVFSNDSGKGENKKVTSKPDRPLCFYGNFPNPPRSSALGSMALLGAIGEFSKEAEVSTLAQKVLNSLKDATMYMIKYGGASTFTYNHHIIDLAKECKLKEIVDSIYFTQLYNEGRRTSQSTEYQKFDLFSSRFLQLFNRPAFKDFLSFRAEYPFSLDILFNTYFKKIEMIDPEIVSSARALGRWLNQVAYFAAKAEVKEGTGNYWEELRKVKAKVLVELESSTFSAKSGDALIAQAVTRAGRLSGMSAPIESALFMEKTASGELQLDNAKNLLIAFSRLKNKTELKEAPIVDVGDSEENEEGIEDLSNE